MIKTIASLAVLSFLPISELRGAIPVALAQGMPWYYAYPLASLCNVLVVPVCWLFLSTLHQSLLRFSWYQKIFNRFVARTRKKLAGPIEKWGAIAIAFFIAIPLPLTGVWTGTLGAWLCGVPKGQTFLAAALGVVLSGALVSFITVFLT
ncbi:MAG: small multi-drug export protein [Spirochaetaceae bacterium]|jgi:uncharacterized membrane protein|nr:small multi-drug export protein [Spirochaetaceae bacterium]